MKKLFLKILILCVILGAVVVFYLNNISAIVTHIMGISTEQQIVQGFENAVNKKYDCLILGSSKFYRGVNPDKITAINSFNFSHDNDAFNQIYYKLLYLKKKNALKFKYVIVGVSCFQFSFLSDTRNYVFNRYFDDEYQKDFEKESGFFSLFSFKEKENKLNEFVTINISNTVPYFMLGVKSIILNKKEEEKSFLKSNGQYIVRPVTKASPNDKMLFKSNVLPVQYKYFEKIIEFTSQNNIKLILVNMPMRETEIKSFSDSIIARFDNLFQSKTNNNKVFYLNFGRVNQFTINDYMDYTHLNPEGADKFSVMLNDSLNKIISK